MGFKFHMKITVKQISDLSIIKHHPKNAKKSRIMKCVCHPIFYHNGNDGLGSCIFILTIRTSRIELVILSYINIWSIMCTLKIYYFHSFPCNRQHSPLAVEQWNSAILNSSKARHFICHISHKVIDKLHATVPRGFQQGKHVQHRTQVLINQSVR